MKMVRCRCHILYSHKWGSDLPPCPYASLFPCIRPSVYHPLLAATLYSTSTPGDFKPIAGRRKGEHTTYLETGLQWPNADSIECSGLIYRDQFSIWQWGVCSEQGARHCYTAQYKINISSKLGYCNIYIYILFSFLWTYN